LLPQLVQVKLLAMKNKTWLITFLSAATIAVGCDKEKTTAQQIETVKTETKQAASDMKDYTFAQKDDFVKSMQAQLTTLNQDLDKLAAKIDGSSDAIKAEAKPKLQALRDQAAKLNAQLADDQNATASTWDSVKAGTKKAYDSMAASFADARQWMSDKIAP
jgi:chromosome segregation ATPase